MRLIDVWQGLIGSDAGLGEAGAAALGGHEISEVVVDSRAVRPNALFVALPGTQTNGCLFLPDALQHGAIAAIAEPPALDLDLPATFVDQQGQVLRRADREGSPVVFVVPGSLAALQHLAEFWRSQMPVQVIGITGSVGKTTTKETVANVLDVRYLTLRNERNLNNEIGLPLTLLRLTREHQRAVLEMGMYDIGEIALLCRMARPLIGVVTNVGPTHLERLGSIERVALAKSELVQALPPASAGGVAILNADDPLVMGMANQTQARVFTYGLEPASDLWADDIVSQGLEGITFTLHAGSRHLHVSLPMLGRHSVHTALRAAAVGMVQDLSWNEIVAGLQAERGNLRLMVVPGLHDTTLIDDTYNASPTSMLAALNLLDDVANADHRAIAVLGDMLELGSFEEAGHRLVGGRAAQVVDKLITVGPRSRLIAEGALATGMNTADVYPTDSNADALAILQGLVQAGDIVLIKGSRGLQMESIVDALSRPQAAQS